MSRANEFRMSPPSIADAAARETEGALRRTREVWGDFLHAYRWDQESAAAVEAERQQLALHFENRITPLHSEVIAHFRRLLGVEAS